MTLLIDSSTMNYPFQTARLRVRDFTPDDRDAFHDMLSNPNVMRHIKGTLNREESDHELIRFICRHEDPNDFVHVWAIESEADDCIGLCGVYDNGKGENELAYRLRERYWGQGYGKEIAGALIDHCFDVLKVDKLTAYVRAANTGSVRILERYMQFDRQFFCEEAGAWEKVFIRHRPDTPEN